MDTGGPEIDGFCVDTGGPEIDMFSVGAGLLAMAASMAMQGWGPNRRQAGSYRDQKRLVTLRPTVRGSP